MATDKKQIEKDILSYLEEKYDQSFIVKSIKWENNVSGKTTDKHFIVLAPESNPEITFDAKVSYENKNKEFELIFEYYPRILINQQADNYNRKVIDHFLNNYTSETKVLNLIKLTDAEIPSETVPYYNLLKKNPDKWTAELTIDTEYTIPAKIYENMLWALIEDHKKRYHQKLNLIVKGTIDGYNGSTHMLKISDITKIESIDQFKVFLEKSIHF